MNKFALSVLSLRWFIAYNFFNYIIENGYKLYYQTDSIYEKMVYLL